MLWQLLQHLMLNSLQICLYSVRQLENKWGMYVYEKNGCHELDAFRGSSMNRKETWQRDLPGSFFMLFSDSHFDARFSIENHRKPSKTTL